MINWKGGYDNIPLEGALFHAQSGIPMFSPIYGEREMGSFRETNFFYWYVKPMKLFGYLFQIYVLTIDQSALPGRPMSNVTPGKQPNIVLGPASIVVSTVCSVVIIFLIFRQNIR